MSRALAIAMATREEDRRAVRQLVRALHAAGRLGELDAPRLLHHVWGVAPGAERSDVVGVLAGEILELTRTLAALAAWEADDEEDEPSGVPACFRRAFRDEDDG